MRRDVSQLQFSDTLVTCLLLSEIGAWGFTVPKNCGGPAVAVLRRSSISLSWEADSYGLPARKTVETPQLHFFPGGRCPCCAGRVPYPLLCLTSAHGSDPAEIRGDSAVAVPLVVDVAV